MQSLTVTDLKPNPDACSHSLVPLSQSASVKKAPRQQENPVAAGLSASPAIFRATAHFFGLEARSLIAAGRGPRRESKRVAGGGTIDVSEKIKLARIECCR